MSTAVLMAATLPRCPPSKSQGPTCEPQAGRSGYLSFGQEGVDGRFGDLHQHDASKLSREFCQVASIPVAPVFGDYSGDRIDEASAVVADKCDHHRFHGRDNSAIRHRARPLRSEYPSILLGSNNAPPRGGHRTGAAMSTTNITSDQFEETVLGDGIVLIDFWAEWCGPCKSFAPVYETVSEQYPEITFAKVDTEQEQQLSGELGIRSIPTIMAFRDGVQLFSQPGAMGEKDLTELVKQIEKLDMDEIRKEIEAHADEAEHEHGEHCNH
ncbi:putative thioredoxin 2 [Nymphon striatum]|nr:putative thioredoxin 2 [Nymphon striatum]